MTLTRRSFLSIVVALALCGVASAQMGANLCPPSSATDTAKQAGLWQDASTWTDGTVPVAGERVLIPVGMTVTNNGTTADVLWIHVAGKLTFCDHCDTQLNVHTIYVPMGGVLDLGATGMPTTGKCVVEWLPGPFLPGDSTKLSRGLICHGEFMACGLQKTAWTEVPGECAVGATSITLPSAPVNWQVGDRIIITGTDSPRNGVKYQSEFRTITAVNGATVTFDQPLQFRHWKWRADLPFWVGNLTRNIVFRSRDTSTLDNRGHAMGMGTMMNDARYVAFEGMGRTNAMAPVTDPRFDAYGEMVPGSDANVRARYSDHYHRRGQLSQPVIRIGCVVDGSPKWGFLIHDSVAHLKDCIAVNCNGSGFATEEGQERGSIDHCLSALNRGMGEVLTPSGTELSTDDDHGCTNIGDWGIDGSGFWLQGGSVALTNSAATDNSGRGVALFNRTLNGYPVYGSVATWLQYPITVNGTLLPIEYGGVDQVAASAFPVQRVENVWCAHNKVGLQSWTETDRPTPIRGSVRDLTTWGRGACAHLEYSCDMNVTVLKVINDTLIRPVKTDASMKQRSGLILRFPNMTVRQYEFVGATRLEDIKPSGTNHVVE